MIPKRSKVEVILIDMNGHEVIRSEEGMKSSGQHFIQIDTALLSKGLYTGALKVGDEVQHFKLLIN